MLIVAPSRRQLRLDKSEWPGFFGVRFLEIGGFHTWAKAMVAGIQAAQADATVLAENHAFMPDMHRDSVRRALLLFPGAGIVAGAAYAIVVVIFGARFAPPAAPLTLLMFGGLGGLVIAVTTSIMIAVTKPPWTFAFTGPLVPVAAVGQYLFIPRYGINGAAGVTGPGRLLAYGGAWVAVKLVVRSLLSRKAGEAA